MKERDNKFYTIPYQNAASHKDTFASQHPIFIFPGISGNKIETLKLGEILNDLNEGKRLVNIYTGDYRDLKKDAKQVADILSEAPSKRFHFLLVGYSYGCSMAVLVAQYLQALGHIPHLVLIDSPSPELMKDYFKSSKNAIAVTEDLISVMSYMAKFSSFEPVSFDHELIAKLAKEEFFSRIDLISKHILEHQNKRLQKNAGIFRQAQEGIKQKFQNLLNLQKDKTCLEKINLLLTDQTDRKFSTQTGGWDAYAEEVHLLPTDKDNLSKIDHTQLLVDHASCTTIAKLIHEIFIEDVLLKEMNIFLTDYSASHKDTPIDYDRILNKLKKQLSEMGLLISFREKIEIEGFGDPKQKLRDGLAPATLKTSNSKAMQHFGMFNDNVTEDKENKTENDLHKEIKTASEQSSP